MEKLNPKTVGLSLGITFAILSLLCLVLIALFSMQTMMVLVNYFTHGIDLSNMPSKQISFVGSIIGLIELFVSGVVIGYIYAIVYNWLGKRNK